MRVEPQRPVGVVERFGVVGWAVAGELGPVRKWWMDAAGVLEAVT